MERAWTFPRNEICRTFRRRFSAAISLRENESAFWDTVQPACDRHCSRRAHPWPAAASPIHTRPPGRILIIMTVLPPGRDGLPLLGETLPFAKNPFGFIEQIGRAH